MLLLAPLSRAPGAVAGWAGGWWEGANPCNRAGGIGCRPFPFDYAPDTEDPTMYGASVIDYLRFHILGLSRIRVEAEGPRARVSPAHHFRGSRRPPQTPCLRACFARQAFVFLRAREISPAFLLAYPILSYVTNRDFMPDEP